MRTVRRMDGALACVLIADLIALVVFAGALVVVLADGLRSSALFIGAPPLVLAVIGTLLFATAHRWSSRWPLIVAIALCGIAILGAMTSFITLLLLATAPVAALLMAACAARLTARRVQIGS